MQLFSRIEGRGKPLLILHGLFGMSDNWLTIGRHLASRGFLVHIPDMRNHGRSPHNSSHRYTDMVDDLTHYCEEHQLESFSIIGHSMGGKLAMIFALLYPELVEKLVVVDMAPADYRSPANTFHAKLIATLLSYDLATYTRRGEIRKVLNSQLNDTRLTAFLSKNITKSDRKGSFTWRCNLKVLQKYLPHLLIGLDDLEPYAPSPLSALFIKGNNSEYYLDEHDEQRLHFFPQSQLVGIDNAGHWVHSEQPDRFLSVTCDFLIN